MPLPIAAAAVGGLKKAGAKALKKVATKVATQKASKKKKGVGKGTKLTAALIAVAVLLAWYQIQLIANTVSTLAGASSGDLDRQANEACDNGDGGGNATPVDQDIPPGGDYLFPITGAKGYQMTSPMGPRSHPKGMHYGADFTATDRSSMGLPLRAMNSGKVTYAGPGPGSYGNLVVYITEDGTEFRYAHLSKVTAKKGTTVKRGENVGNIGNTDGGSNRSSGAHLHLEIRPGGQGNPSKMSGKRLDPVKWFKAKGINVATGTSKDDKKTAATAGDRAIGDDTATKAHPAGLSAITSYVNQLKVAEKKPTVSLPKPGKPTNHVPGTKPIPIPKNIKKMYVKEGKRFGIPWTLLAGIGMEETHHGTYPGYENPNRYGAGGIMAWIEKYFKGYAQDGDGDGKKEWSSDADQIATTAYRLSTEGARDSQEGVRKALYSYNHAVWYVNDVLWYAHKYGGGNIGEGPDTTPTSDGCVGGRGGDSTPISLSECVTSKLKPMSAEEKAAQLMMVAMQAGSSPSSLKNLIKGQGVGGVIYLGGWNGVSTVKKTSTKLQSYAPASNQLLIAADQEGGNVWGIRDSDYPKLPTAVQQGKASSAQRQKYGTQVAAQLKKAGINLNLAPVADTVPAAIGKRNGPIGQHDRQFGSDPKKVGKATADLVQGMSSGGLMTTVKHFPGIGRIKNNTDLSSTGITDTEMTTSDPHLQPFKQGLKAGSDIVMVSSAKYPKLDGSTPATFSKKIITGLLRGKLSHSGVVITDDVAAKALSGTAPGQRAVKYVAAGGDIVLTGDPTAAKGMISALAAKMKSDPAFTKKVNASVRRVLTLKGEHGLVKCAGSTSSATTKGFQKTLKSYVHPDNVPDGRLRPTPGYAAAVQRARKEGRFVGHLASEPEGRPVGIHCSAFLSLLMTDSGYDPTYNYGGRINQGAGFVGTQLAWMKEHWTTLGAGSKLELSDLKPGDVGISNGDGLTHVWVYIGKVPGLKGNFAEASYIYSGKAGFAPQARQSDEVLYRKSSATVYFRKPAGGAKTIAYRS